MRRGVEERQQMAEGSEGVREGRIMRKMNTWKVVRGENY